MTIWRKNSSSAIAFLGCVCDFGGMAGFVFFVGFVSLPRILAAATSEIFRFAISETTVCQVSVV